MFYPHCFGTLIASVRRRLRRGRAGAAPDLTCEQVVGLIADYLTGALTPETRAAFEAHLQGCDHCLAFLNTYKQTITTVQLLRFEALPEEMEARVRDFLKQDETVWRRSLAPFRACAPVLQLPVCATTSTGDSRRA
jgi:anti-sigma factor RsiW